MKAVALDGYGMDAVEVREVADPAPGPDDVTVRVRAAALNHLDLWTLAGSLQIPHDFPHVLGADAAGEIAERGDRVAGLRSGTRVVVNPAISCGECEFCRAGEQSLCTRFAMLGEHVPGTFAHFVRVPARNVFPMPGHLSFVEAAALGVTFVTAYRMLFTRAHLAPGEWVLITGIGGGLAQATLQLALGVAGRVFVTSSSDGKLERALGMGAEAGINYARDDVGKAVRRLTGKRGVDVVADSAGGAALDGALRSLRKGGRLVVAGATAGATAEIDVRRVFWNQLEIIGSTMGSDRDMADMLRHVAGASLHPVVDATYPLDEAKRALARLDSGDHFGKLVLEVS